MSTACITLPQQPSPPHCCPYNSLWNEQDNAKLDGSCNDHTTVYTDVSDHSSTCPEVSNLD